MAKGQKREEKWVKLEERVKEEIEKARRRASVADNFDEMEEIVEEVGQVIKREMLSAVAEQREVGGRPKCPECREGMYRRGRKARQMKTSQGEVSFERDRWVCLACGANLFPPG